MRHVFDPTEGRLRNDVAFIQAGGTKASSPKPAVSHLGGIDVDSIGQPLGIAGLDDQSKLYLENANLSKLIPIPTATGPKELFVLNSGRYLITNYDINISYVLDVVGNGSVRRVDNIVIYTAPSEPSGLELGVDGFTLNDTVFPILVKEPIVINLVLQPSIIYPNQYHTLRETQYTFRSTLFSYIGAYQSHDSSTWQIATDSEFTELVLEETASITNKTEWLIGEASALLLLENVDYYIRIKHTGSVSGDSKWSDPFLFKLDLNNQEVVWVQKPTITRYQQELLCYVHPPFITGINDPYALNAIYNDPRSIELQTDGTSNAFGAVNTIVKNGIQYIKHPYMCYPFPMTGQYGFNLNVVGSGLYLIGSDIVRLYPDSATFEKMDYAPENLHGVARYGYSGVAQVDGNLYFSENSAFISKLSQEDNIIKPLEVGGLPVSNYPGMAIDGNDVYAVSYSAGVYKQTNGTGDFVSVGQNNLTFSNIAVSGSTIYTYVSGGDIYKYNTGNDTFEALGQTIRNWSCIAIVGNDVFVGTHFGLIYKQTNGTGDFVPLTSTNEYWNDLTSDGVSLYGSTGATYGDVYTIDTITGEITSVTMENRRWDDMLVVGTSIYTCIRSGDIYKKSAGDSLYTKLNQTHRDWTGLANVGTDIYACVYGGDIYKQTNGTGDFVALNQTSRAWSGITALGTDIYAVDNTGDIYKQTNGTGDFVSVNSGSGGGWNGITVLNNDVYACNYFSGIYKQTNGTGEFTLYQAGSNWTDIKAIGSDIYACVSNGKVYKLPNGTGIFAPIPYEPNRYWESIFTDNIHVYGKIAFQKYLFKQTNMSGNFQILAPSLPNSVDSLAINNDSLYLLMGGTDVYTLSLQTAELTEIANAPESLYNIRTSNGVLYGGGITTVLKNDGGASNFVQMGQTYRDWVGITASDTALYASDSIRGLFRISTDNYTMTQLNSEFNQYGPLMYYNGYVYYIAESKIYQYDPTTYVSTQITDPSKSDWCALYVMGDSIFAATYNGVVYKISLTDQSMEAIINESYEVKSMVIFNSEIYLHITNLNGNIPIQNGICRFDLDGNPILIDEMQMGPILLSGLLLSDDFTSVGGSQNHLSSTWEISTSNTFTPIIYSADGDTGHKTSLPISNLPATNPLYARVKYTGSVSGDSEWSDPFNFTVAAYGESEFYVDNIREIMDSTGLDAIVHDVDMSNDGSIVVAAVTEISIDGTVEGSASVYVYRNKVREAELIGSDIYPTDYTFFGKSIAINDAGTRIFVTAPFKDNQGAVYVYDFIDPDWVETAILNDPRNNEADQFQCFGSSVACNALGDRIAVGRSPVSSNNFGTVYGNGVVYVYDYVSPSTWSVPVLIEPSTNSIDDEFGSCLKMNAIGDLIAIGAPGNQFYRGCVYVFQNTIDGWNESYVIKPGSADSYDIRFGQSLDIDRTGHIIYIGAPNESSIDIDSQEQYLSGALYKYEYDSDLDKYTHVYKDQHTVADEQYGICVSCDNTGSTVSVQTTLKTYIYVLENTGMVLQNTYPSGVINPISQWPMYVNRSIINKSGTLSAQIVNYGSILYDNVYSSYLHLYPISILKYQTHVSSDWQISMESNFNTSVMEVYNDHYSKEKILLPYPLAPDHVYYVRAKYTGDITGKSKWGLAYAHFLINPGE